MDGNSFVDSLIYLVVVGIALGIFHFLIGRAPFLSPMFKTVLQWIVYVVGAVVLIDFLLGLTGNGFIHWR